MLLNIISLIVSILSLTFAVITWIKTRNYRKRVRIDLNRVTDDSHALFEELKKINAPQNILDRYSSFNHSLTVTLISLDKKLAHDWVFKHYPTEKDWPTWEVNLQISMNKYRRKN